LVTEYTFQSLEGQGAISLAISVFLFVVTYQLFSETKKLVAADVPPIVSILVTLFNNVVVLLFWHQLQKKQVS